MSSVTTLPEVDLSHRPGQLRERLREVAHEVVFFYLIGHGVPEALTRRVLAAAQRLFALPQAQKDAVAMVRSPHFRGYTRLGGELTGGEGVDVAFEALGRPATVVQAFRMARDGGAVVCVGIAAGAAALWGAPRLIPADGAREAVTAQIRAVTGIEPAVHGRVEVSLFPSGTVRLGDVVLGGADQFAVGVDACGRQVVDRPLQDPQVYS